MNLKHIKEEYDNWYSDDEFHISETEPEDTNYTKNEINSE